MDALPSTPTKAHPRRGNDRAGASWKPPASDVETATSTRWAGVERNSPTAQIRVRVDNVALGSVGMQWCSELEVMGPHSRAVFGRRAVVVIDQSGFASTVAGEPG